ATLSCPGIIKAAIKAAIKVGLGVAAAIKAVPGAVALVASQTGQTHQILIRFLRIFVTALAAECLVVASHHGFYGLSSSLFWGYG
ncbi:MAG: hypothetical protein ACPG6Y_07270, partial [Candidatus Puniceispirillaceae bacterium]